MKRIILVLLCVGILLFPIHSMCASKTLTFTWNQDSGSLSILAGWKVYQATASGGPYTLLSSITYDGTPKSSYTGTGTINQSDGTSKVYYFVCRALGKSGLESANSNEVSATIDLTVPGVPVTFTVTVTN
jgi:hypothetical protein